MNRGKNSKELGEFVPIEDGLFRLNQTKTLQYSPQDGIPDILDRDDDNDGIPDHLDVDGVKGLGIDSDGDGFPDAIDDDMNDDGIPDHLQDHDCDGIPDILDPDDDNDGYFDNKQVGGSDS